jgi:hypothetical protein
MPGVEFAILHQSILRVPILSGPLGSIGNTKPLFTRAHPPEPSISDHPTSLRATPQPHQSASWAALDAASRPQDDGNGERLVQTLQDCPVRGGGCEATYSKERVCAHGANGRPRWESVTPCSTITMSHRMRTHRCGAASCRAVATPGCRGSQPLSPRLPTAQPL